MTDAIAPELETLVGSADIICWETAQPRWKRAVEKAIAPNQAPSYIIYPHTPEALSETIQIARDRRWAVLPCGSGSKLGWGGLVKAVELVVSTERLNRVIEHAVGDLTVTVEAGVKLAELQRLLNQFNQFLPLDPAYADAATIGGIVATADTGSWRQRYGGVRDMVLGLSFVRADGQIVKAGGRVVKNVAGYDLMKLFTGSYGTLGAISQVTLRGYPLPEASGTILITGQSAIATAAQFLRSSALTPTAADLLSAGLVQSLDIGRGVGLIARFQSIPESVKEQIAQLEAMAHQLGLQVEEISGARESQLWERLQQIHVSTVDSGITCKIGVLPIAAPNVLNQLDTLTSQQGLGLIGVSSGLGKLYLSQLPEIEKMRSLCEENQGFLTVLAAPISIKQQLDPWGYTGNALEMMRKLKQQFDSETIFSPGRFVGGI